MLTESGNLAESKPRQRTVNLSVRLQQRWTFTLMMVGR